MYTRDQAMRMKDPHELYSDLLEAGADKDEMKEVGEDILEVAFESDTVNIEYRTEDPTLNVGEPTVDSSRFLVDGVRVQNVGMNAGARVDIRGSYYDRAAQTEQLLSPGPDLTPGAKNNGELITVHVNLQLTLSQHGVEGEGMVLFTKGRD